MSDMPRCATCRHFERSQGEQWGECRGYGSYIEPYPLMEDAPPRASFGRTADSWRPTAEELGKMKADHDRRRRDWEERYAAWLVTVKFDVTSDDPFDLQVHETFGCVRHEERQA